eukprot:9776734-Ditylum_brightwellii.AAC.1
MNVDLQDYNTFLNWMIDHGHPAFCNTQPLTKCHEPIMIQERENRHTTMIQFIHQQKKPLK